MATGINFMADPKWDGLDKAVRLRKVKDVRHQIENLLNSLEDAIDPDGVDAASGGPMLLISNAFAEMEDMFDIIQKALDQ